jgi:hypothetical protein
MQVPDEATNELCDLGRELVPDATKWTEGAFQSIYPEDSNLPVVASDDPEAFLSNLASDYSCGSLSFYAWVCMGRSGAVFPLFWPRLAPIQVENFQPANRT